MRSLLKRRRRSVAVLAPCALALAMSTGAGATLPTGHSEPSLRLIAPGTWTVTVARVLSGDVMLERWSDGQNIVGVVGRVGSTVYVSSSQTAPRTARHGTAAISVAVRSSAAQKDRRAWPLAEVDELMALGVPGADARKYAAVPGTGTPPQVDSIETKAGVEVNAPRDTPCVTVAKDKDGNGTPRVNAYGCNKQTLDYVDPNDPGQWYLVDEFHASGWTNDTSLLWPDHLTWLEAGVFYGPGNSIIEWDPGYDRPVSDSLCRAQSTTVNWTYSGAGASYTQGTTVCPNGFGPSALSQTSFKAGWSGYDPTQAFFEQTIGDDYVGNPPGDAATATFVVHVNYCWGCAS